MAATSNFASAGPTANFARLQKIQVYQTTYPDLIALFGNPQESTQKGNGWYALFWQQGYSFSGEQMYQGPSSKAGTNFETLNVQVIDGKVVYYSYYGGGKKVREGTPPPFFRRDAAAPVGSHIPL